MIRRSNKETAWRKVPFVASVTVTHVPGTTYQTRIDTGDLALIGDEPIASGGDGLGPSPYEFLLAALGHCTVLTILLYARRKGWPVDGVSVRANHERLVVEEEIDGEVDAQEGRADRSRRSRCKAIWMRRSGRA